MKNFRKKMENILVAASFAEANAHETAKEYLNLQTLTSGFGRQLQAFLQDVGLQDVQVTYGIARL